MKKFILALLITLCAGLVFFHPGILATGSTPTSLTDQHSPGQIGVKDHFGGRSEAIAIQGNNVYLGSGAEMVILNFSDPDHPTRVGSYLFPHLVMDIAVSGDHAYVAAGWVGGFWVVDISNPSQLEAYSLKIDGNSVAVAVSENYAYVATSNAGLRVIDISDPAQLKEIGNYYIPATQGWLSDVLVSGSYVYCSDNGYGGLYILDVSQPASPILVSHYETTEWDLIQGIAIAQETIFAANQDTGLQIIDISIAAAPSQKSEYPIPGGANAVRVVADRAYVAGRKGQFIILDISNLASPVEVSSLTMQSQLGKMVVAGLRAYIASPNLGGLRIVDLADPANPLLVQSHWVWGEVRSVAASGPYAYLATTSGGLHMIDTSDPDSLSPAGSLDPTGDPWDVWDVEVSGNLALLANGQQGLTLVDIAAPNTPVILSNLDTPGETRKVAYSDGYAYLADEEGGFRIINIMEAGYPCETACLYCLDPYTPVHDVAVQGDYAYLTYGDGIYGLKIVDVSDPSNPQEIGELEVFGMQMLGLAVSGTRAYTLGNALLAIDITSPDHPFVLGAHLPLIYGDLVVSGDRAYIAGGSEFFMVDIADPTTLKTIGEYHTPTPGNHRDVALSEAGILAAAGTGGLYNFIYLDQSLFLPLVSH